MSIFSSKMKWHFIIWSCSKFLKIKMIFFIKSWVYIKNVILWCISCYCSSKKEKTGGGHKSYNCSFWAPSNFLDFWASPSWCTSKEHIFYVELGFWQKEINLRLKKLKKSDISKFHFILLLKMVILLSNFSKNFDIK